MNDIKGYPKTVQIAGDRIKPQPVDFEETIVNFDLAQGVLADFVEVEFTAISYAVQSHGGSLPSFFTQEAFTKYCNSAIYSRVMWVNGMTNKIIFRPEERVMIPSLLDAILKNIGTVYNVTLGISLKPGFKDESAVEVLDKAECLKISQFLQSISTYIGALGYVKDKSGSWDFMAMRLVDDYIQSHSDAAHPAYAVLASVVGPSWVNDALLSPRVKYANKTYFKGILWQLTSV